MCIARPRLCWHEAEVVGLCTLCPIKHSELLIFYGAPLNYEGNQSRLMRLPRCAHWWISSLLTCCRAPRVCMGKGKESEGRRQPSLHTATQGCCWARANHKLAGRRCSARMLKYEQRFDNCAWCMLLASLLMPLHFCIVAAITQVQNNSVKKIQYLMFDRIHASTAFRLLYLLHFYSAQMNF